MFAAGYDGVSRAPHVRGSLPEEWARPLAAIAGLGGVGGFLSVMAKNSWRMQIGGMVRGYVLGACALGVFLVSGAATFLGGYLLWNALGDVLPPMVAPIAGFLLSAIIVGLGLGVAVEFFTRLVMGLLDGTRRPITD
jgi:hypothetical protein